MALTLPEVQIPFVEKFRFFYKIKMTPPDIVSAWI